MRVAGKVGVALGLLALGAAIGALAVGVGWHRVMSSFSATAVLEIAVDAVQLKRGEADAVLSRKAEALPILAQQVHLVHRKYLTEDQYNGTLWAVQRFYEEASAEVPSAIAPILQALPPRPPCRLSTEPAS